MPAQQARKEVMDWAGGLPRSGSWSAIATWSSLPRSTRCSPVLVRQCGRREPMSAPNVSGAPCGG